MSGYPLQPHGIEDILSESEEESDGEEESHEDDVDSNDQEPEPWISWFCSFRGHEFFCEIDEDYIRDNFNLTGLNTVVPHYELALDLILDDDMDMEKLPRQKRVEIERSASMLYGMIHARYIITGGGMQRMMEKYQHAEFGCCPRIYCRGQPVLPVGLFDTPTQSGTNVFCPLCHEIYAPKSTSQGSIDGAFFGTTFAHLFLLIHPQCIPKSPPSESAGEKYVPRIFGYKINRESPYYQNRKPALKSKNASSSPTADPSSSVSPAAGFNSKDL